MNKAFYLIIVLLISMDIKSQNKMKSYDDKVFIFQAYVKVQECDNLGATENSFTTAIQGSLFKVVNVTNDNNLVIVFLKFNLPKQNTTNKQKEQYNLALKNRATYNFKAEPEGAKPSLLKTNDNIKFFLLKKSDFDDYCLEYTKPQYWSLTFGSFTTPFKFRNHPSLFTANLNLGANVCLQRKFAKDFSIGVIAGISLSSVTLDSFSTKGFVTTNTDRPAVTPTADVIFGYKNVNLIFGLGWDIVNRTTDIEKSWIYNGGHWVGLGIGISLFSSSSQTNSSVPAANQSK